MLKKGFGNFIMNNDKEFLATEPIEKLLLRLAIPTLAAQMINMLYNIIDRIYIGHIPGSGALALTGVGVCMPLIMIISAFAALVGNGGAPRASILMGKKDLDSAENILGNCFTMQIIISVILTLIMFFGNRTFLMAFGASENTIEYAVSYMNIYSLGTIFVQLTLGMNAFITAQGFAKTGMYSVLIGAVINIILDPIFIFGMLGMPKMGVAGAAVATVAGQILSMIVAAIVLFCKDHDVKISFRGFKLRWNTIRNIYAVGFPAIIMQSIGSVMVMGMNAILIVFTETAVAFFGIYFKLQSFVFMSVFGLTQGLMPIMGYNYGARNRERLVSALKIGSVIALVIMACGMILFWAVPDQLLLIFNASENMLGIGVPALRIISLSFLPAALGILFSTLFQAVGHGVSSLIVSVLRQLVVLLPAAFLLSQIGLPPIWYAFPIAEVASLLASIFMFARMYRKTIKNL